MTTPKKIKVTATRPIYEGSKRYAKGDELTVTPTRHKALGKSVTPPAVKEGK